jgi:uncharacterized protein
MQEILMPRQSKYSNSQFEALMHEIIIAIEKSKADRDLSLMVLGNVISSIFQQQVDPNHRAEMADKFTQILLKSINGK